MIDDADLALIEVMASYERDPIMLRLIEHVRRLEEDMSELQADHDSYVKTLQAEQEETEEQVRDLEEQLEQARAK